LRSTVLDPELIKNEVRKRIEDILKKYNVVNRCVRIYLCDPLGDIVHIHVDGFDEETCRKLTDEVTSLSKVVSEELVQNALDEVLKELGCEVEWIL